MLEDKLFKFIQDTIAEVTGKSGLVYETDFVDCTLFDGIATNTAEYCKKGDVIGVKGRIQTDIYEKDGEKRKSTQIIADKITFLSSSKEHQKEDDLEV